MSGSNRKSSLKALFGEPMPPAPETKSMPSGDNSDVPSQAVKSDPPRATSGAVKAMGLSLSAIAREAEEARALRQAMEEGERILSLDADKIDGSFVSDRLSEEQRDDPDFLTLIESIRESGQQVPILVRPHPQAQDRFQVAYGHRRLRAARRLGVPVKAIVRQLGDEELVLAQGKENAERRNLSFIERALFAKTLTDRGFERKLIGDALAVQKSELSRLLQVAEAVPIRFARQIGPAPKAGRARWMALGELLSTGAGIEKATDEVYSERFKSAQSDERFTLLFDRLSRRSKQAKAVAEDLKGPDGKSFARMSRQGRAVKIEFKADVSEQFLETLKARLGEDYAAFVKNEGGDS
ncbi:plasmid partitioning protein RepB [Agrobacterium sp. ES01]|uniref:plasmid partitioning protein RepB n=1 Tax=Agrobacterium sp. ES01 TaxID=3420714 RepID=UPI003D123922